MMRVDSKWGMFLSSPVLGNLELDFVISNLVPQKEWDQMTEVEQVTKLNSVLSDWIDYVIDLGFDCTEIQTKKKKTKSKPKQARTSQ